MTYKIALLPGDGIGPEVVDAARRVLDATRIDIDWDYQEAGSDAIEKYGTPLPQAALDSVKRNKVALKGPFTTPIESEFRSINVALRQELDLYACIRPCKAYEGVPTRFPGADLVVVRENHEDVFAGIEYRQGSNDAAKLRDFVCLTKGIELREDAGVSLKPISVFATERAVRTGFEYAISQGRRKVTVAHKANVMKFTDGLFVEIAQRVAREYAQIEFETCFIDFLCSQLVVRPENYDVIVLPNLYGDIVSDLGAGLTGGLGMAPGANIGDECAVFEAGHGSAPKHRGKNKVNPIGLILSGAMMLRHLGENEAAETVENAVATVLKKGRVATYDLKMDRNDPGAAGTSKVADAVIETMASAT